MFYKGLVYLITAGFIFAAFSINSPDGAKSDVMRHININMYESDSEFNADGTFLFINPSGYYNLFSRKGYIEANKKSGFLKADAISHISEYIQGFSDIEDTLNGSAVIQVDNVSKKVDSNDVLIQLIMSEVVSSE